MVLREPPDISYQESLTFPENDEILSLKSKSYEASMSSEII